MSSSSLMEWNTKPPIQWDWENLMMFNATTEHPKKLRLTEWEIDGGRGIDSGSLYSSGSGSGSGTGGSGSDLGLASLSKSSKSASINSSSVGEVKTSKLTLEASEAIPEDSNNEKALAKAKPTGTSSLEASVGSGEALLGLKLGKRTYFEDVCAGNNAKTSSFSVIPGSSVSPVKKSNPAVRLHQPHGVKFHGLSEFDEKKRSCRRRLSDHNARRRKPQPESGQLNPARLSSSLYGERQQTSLVWNRAPLIHSRPNANLTWEGTSSSKFTITKRLLDNFAGLEESIISPNVDATQDLHRALSLLSTNSWGSCEQKSVSHEQPAHTSASHTGMPQSVLHVMSQGMPLASTDYWRTEQTTDSREHTLTAHNDSSSYFQEFQLLRNPYDSDFYSSQLN
ncbi:hypothetical protein GH714_029700 [Hevea brasiliensis]|uniref:SBP-type domain-containing protein n=1 Tax=Hevea brasiliensis TaxID=3981 RepID=A0A6A6KY53_HEVBR|nr:hypothetical protein GH714_029700 [Hevea brasiliensis]